MTVNYNLPDVGSHEWYSSPLYPAVADLDRRVGITEGYPADIAAALAAAQAAQATANAAVAVKPYWFGYLVSNQSTTNWPNNTLITWTQDAVSGGFSYSAGVVTLPALDGRYRVTASLYYDQSTAAGVRLSQVYSGSTGGSPLITASAGNPAQTTTHSGVSATAVKTLQLTAGYQIRVLAAQDAGGFLNVLAGRNQSYFQVEYLGAN